MRVYILQLRLEKNKNLVKRTFTKEMPTTEITSKLYGVLWQRGKGTYRWMRQNAACGNAAVDFQKTLDIGTSESRVEPQII